MSVLKQQKLILFICLVAVVFPLCQAAIADASAYLKEYVNRPDEAFAFEVVRKVDLVNADGYMLRLTSQKWRDTEWTHWLSIVVPHELKHPDKALLIVEGGRNRDEVPEVDARLGVMLSYLSQQIGSPIAVLQQVPNQPLKGGRYEDDLIAYTFDKYFETGDPEYPLLLPMTKSAVAAMDAITQWSQQQYDQGIESFFVTGASKRGWTTWLTAAVDDRITGIAPLVIDMLNVEPQMQQQLKTYGQYSHMIRDYTEHNILAQMGTEKAENLLQIVDPYSYRQDITVPKLIVLGTNDPYWTVDAANLYVPGLVGPTHLYYSPNAGHGLSPESIDGISTTIMSMASFIRRHFDGREMPQLTWRHEQPDKLIVEWDDEDAQAMLWSAKSPNRDFRDSRWQSRPLQGSGSVEVDMPQPEDGWQAWFVEVRFGGEYPMRLSTAMTVLPDEFPYED